jgi:hypothetical protein
LLDRREQNRLWDSALTNPSSVGAKEEEFMRRSGRLFISVIAAALLSIAIAASVSAHPLPEAACNQGTANAHGRGEKSSTAHAAIPIGDGACAHVVPGQAE